MSLGAIKIEVGANLNGLSIKLEESLGMIDDWSGKASDKNQKLWETFSEGFASGPLDVTDQFGAAFSSIGAIIERLDKPLGLLPDKVHQGISMFGGLSDNIGETLGLMGDLQNYTKNLTSLFPALGLSGSSAFGMIRTAASSMWAAITGPVGAVVGAVTGVFYGLFKLLENASDGVKKFVFKLSNYVPTIRTWIGGMTALEEGIGKIWDSLMGDGISDQTELERALSEISAHWQKVTDISELDKLRSAIALTTEEMSNKFLAGDYKGADKLKKELQTLQARMKGLQDYINPPKSDDDEVSTVDLSDKIYMPGVGFIDKNKFTQLIDEYRAAIDKRAKESDLGVIVKLDNDILTRDLATIHDQISGLTDRKYDIELELKNAQSIEAIERLETELQSVNDQLDKYNKYIAKLPQQTSQSMSALEEMWQDVGQSIKVAGADALSIGITNLFDGADKEYIADLNAELREQQDIRRDLSASKEEREAAEARTKIIQEEIAQEKLRGNAVIQTAGLFIDSAKQIIQAKLAEAMASGAAAELKKGLPGLITAGVVIAGISALFNSKIPKLKDGGVLDGPTLFLGGEYPGAGTNKEIVTPENLMKDSFREVLSESRTSQTTTRQMAPAAAQVIKLNPSVETRVTDSGEIYAMIKLEHENELRLTGTNPFE